MIIHPRQRKRTCTSRTTGSCPSTLCSAWSENLSRYASSTPSSTSQSRTTARRPRLTGPIGVVRGKNSSMRKNATRSGHPCSLRRSRRSAPSNLRCRRRMCSRFCLCQRHPILIQMISQFRTRPRCSSAGPRRDCTERSPHWVRPAMDSISTRLSKTAAILPTNLPSSPRVSSWHPLAGLQMAARHATVSQVQFKTATTPHVQDAFGLLTLSRAKGCCAPSSLYWCRMAPSCSPASAKRTNRS